MALSQATVNKCKKYCLYSYFMACYHKEQYSLIQRFYDAAHFSNNKLLERLKQPRSVGMFVTDIVYEDIIFITADAILEDRALEEMFLSVNQEMFPDVYKKATLALETAKATQKCELLLHETGKKNIRQWYYKYLLYDLGVFDYTASELQTVCMQDAQQLAYHTASEQETLRHKYANFVFDGTDESILDGPFFIKTVERRKKELAEYLGVPALKLADKFHEIMREEMKTEGTYCDVVQKGGIAGIVQTLAMHLLLEQGGGVDWLAFMTSRGSFYEKIKYEPDVDDIIMQYYRSVTLAKIEDCAADDIPFIRTTLSRECKGETIAQDFERICFAYEMDVLLKMMSLLLQEHYKTFSWEAITQVAYGTRVETTIDNYKHVIADKDAAIARLAEENATLRLCSDKDADKAVIAIARKNDELAGKMEEQSKEIERLKKVIASYEQFSAELSKPETKTEEDTEVDYAYLQTKRYLFVGDFPELLPELKKLFPGCVYMANERQRLQKLQVDAVVLLIKRMSHTMYFRVNAASFAGDVPILHCNGLTLEKVCAEMQAQLRQSEAKETWQ